MSKIRFGVGISPHPEDKSQEKHHLQNIYNLLDSIDSSYESAWIPDHFMPTMEPYETDYYECLTLTSYLLPKYPNLKFGQIVLGNNYRNPALLAKMSSTLQELSNRRFILGIGAGWFQQDYQQYGYEFPSPRKRIKQLEEAVQIIKKMWTEDETTFHGKYYNIENAVCYPKPDPVPPIMIGGSGERFTLKVVAKYADWWNGGSTDIDTCGHRLNVLAGHCDGVGRDYDDIVKCVMGIVALADSDEEALKHAKESRYPLDWLLYGSPETVSTHLGKLVDAGIEYFQLFFVPFANYKATQLFSEKVIPELT